MLPRRHLVASGFVAAGICLGNLRSVFAVQLGLAEPTSDPLLMGLTALIAELSCSERLGRACLRRLANPEIPSSDLAQLVIADLDLEAEDHTVGKIQEAVRARIRRDFEERKIIDVDGWCLSLTETRLYAMARL